MRQDNVNCQFFLAAVVLGLLVNNGKVLLLPLLLLRLFLAENEMLLNCTVLLCRCTLNKSGFTDLRLHDINSFRNGSTLLLGKSKTNFFICLCFPRPESLRERAACAVSPSWGEVIEAALQMSCAVCFPGLMTQEQEQIEASSFFSSFPSVTGW